MGIWISVPQCRYPTGKELSGANTLLLEELGMWCTQIAMNLVDIQLEPKAPKGKGPSLAHPCDPEGFVPILSCSRIPGGHRSKTGEYKTHMHGGVL